MWRNAPMRALSLQGDLDLLNADCTFNPLGSEAKFGDFSKIPVHHLFRPPLSHTFLLQAILLTLYKPCF